MSKIEQPKAYSGSELENVFFRPMLSGPDANQLGIKIMYNTPLPTTLHFWKRGGDILQKYGTDGWKGSAAERTLKTIELAKVKAEVGYSAQDYFNMVYQVMTGMVDTTADDVSGTQLENAETTLFKQAIAESIRATMWLGDTSRVGPTAKFNTFDGFIKKIKAEALTAGTLLKSATIANFTDPDAAENIFKNLINIAPNVLKEMKSQGNLVFLVTSDIYAKYEEALDSAVLDSAYIAKQDGRERLSFRGIPVIDIQVSGYLPEFTTLPQTFAILTDKRNLALAVNTADFPGTEVRMWYNPDQMENRQRAIFMAGCDFLMPELITFAYKI